jgi:hypothetical protein
MADRGDAFGVLVAAALTLSKGRHAGPLSPSAIASGVAISKW